MGELTEYLNQNAYKVSSTYNKYNDAVLVASETAIPCMLRQSQMVVVNDHREEITVDGILWFDNNYEPKKGDVYIVDAEYYQIESILPARDRLMANEIQFYKCGVSKQRQIS